MPDEPNLDETRPLPPAAPAFASRYRLVTELGRGGMGVVWRAMDTKLQREVALKFLPDLVVRDREAMADLAAETRRCLELTHPNIVRVYDIIEDGERAAISMELVDGASLAERKLREPDRCFSTAALAPWVAQLCSALDYAHAKVRLVHRDLKPLNLLINAQGDLKIVDFGISRSLLNSGTRLSTAARATSVSLGYACPQQLLGEPPAVTDDIYSLGASLYELLTGKPPFHEGDIVTQHREVVPPPMSARRAALGITGRELIPREWEETVAACLAKKAADRPQSAREVAARLGLPFVGASHYADTADLAASTAGARQHAAATAPRNTRARVVAVSATLAAAALAAIFWPGDSPEEPIPAVPVPPSATLPTNFRGLVVTVSPSDAGAFVAIDKEPIKPVPADGRLGLAGLPDGKHELIVRASGYKTFAAQAEVAEGRGTVAVKLEPVYGPVLVVARPGTVVTAVNERGREWPVGTVPESGQLKADTALVVGSYLFKLAHPDCVEARVPKVSVAVGRPARVAPPQASAPGELLVFSSPDGAEISINGVKVGVTPATLPDQPSEKPLTVDVSLTGYRPARKSVTLKPRETFTHDVGTLLLLPTGIQLRGNTVPPDMPRGAVSIDGKAAKMAKSRVVFAEAGKRTVRIQHPDFEPWQQVVDVVENQHVPVTVTLVPKPGVLTLAVTPPTAFTLSAGGKPVEVNNDRVTLPAEVEHTLEISATGFKSARATVKLPANGKVTLPVTLEPAP